MFCLELGEGAGKAGARFRNLNGWILTRATLLPTSILTWAADPPRHMGVSGRSVAFLGFSGHTREARTNVLLYQDTYSMVCVLSKGAHGAPTGDEYHHHPHHSRELEETWELSPPSVHSR